MASVLVRELVAALAVVLVSACAGQDRSCVSFFQYGVQVSSSAAPLSANAPVESHGKAAPLAEGTLPPFLLEVSRKTIGDSIADRNHFPFGEKSVNISERVQDIWNDDVFVNKAQNIHKNTGDEGWQFFKAAPPVDWIVFAIVCVGAFALDYFVLKTLPDSMMWHLAVIAFWLAVAAGYCVYVGLRMGHQHAIEWASGYVLEWMLSVDNLFVFTLVLTSYKVPAAQVHKAVTVGIIGAVVMRLVFFMVMSTLLHLFTWVRYPFGALLIYSGIEAARSEDDDDDDIEDTRMVKTLRWCLGSRLATGYDELQHSIFMFDTRGRLQVSMLFVVIAVLELSDLIFAVDSVSAKVAQIPQQYIAFTSSVLAMFGLRATFFVVRDLVEIFEYLKYGICVILVFIGVELCLSYWVSLPSSTVCIVLVAVFAVSILASGVANPEYRAALWSIGRTESEHLKKKPSSEGLTKDPISNKTAAATISNESTAASEAEGSGVEACSEDDTSRARPQEARP